MLKENDKIARRKLEEKEGKFEKLKQQLKDEKRKAQEFKKSVINTKQTQDKKNIMVL